MPGPHICVDEHCCNVASDPEFVTTEPRPVDKWFPQSNRAASIAAGVCIPAPLGCGNKADHFRDDLSKKEYHITGLCQSCQDHLYAE